MALYDVDCSLVEHKTCLWLACIRQQSVYPVHFCYVMLSLLEPSHVSSPAIEPAAAGAAAAAAAPVELILTLWIPVS